MLPEGAKQIKNLKIIINKTKHERSKYTCTTNLSFFSFPSSFFFFFPFLFYHFPPFNFISRITFVTKVNKLLNSYLRCLVQKVVFQKSGALM